MDIDNEKLGRLLSAAGLPADVEKIIGAKVQINYSDYMHLFTQITGLSLSGSLASGYFDLRVNVACGKVFSGAEIFYLEFSFVKKDGIVQDNGYWCMFITEIPFGEKAKNRRVEVGKFQIID